MRTEPEYHGHFGGRYLSTDGDAPFKQRPFFVLQTLAHAHSASKRSACAWALCFFDRLLARLNERDFTLRQ